METTPFPDDGVAKNLFRESRGRYRKRKTASPPSSRSNQSSHYDIWRYKSNGGGRKRTPRIGFCGAIIFFALCLAAVVLTVQINTGEWRTIMTMEEISRFFSNELLHGEGQSNMNSSMFYFHGQHIYGLGALPLALAMGMFCALFTCVFTFYDSAIPGNFPPTPVSPRTNNKGVATSPGSQWHLGYIFVPVNFLVAFSLTLFYFRWNMGLPLL